MGDGRKMTTLATLRADIEDAIAQAREGGVTMPIHLNIPANPNASTEPMDGEPTMWNRLQECADDIDNAVTCNPAGTCYFADGEELNRVKSCLEEMADEVFNYCRDHGTVL